MNVAAAFPIPTGNNGLVITKNNKPFSPEFPTIRLNGNQNDIRFFDMDRIWSQPKWQREFSGIKYAANVAIGTKSASTGIGIELER